LDEELLSEMLETLADPRTASKTSKSVQTLRGVRGVPSSEVARVLAAAWQEQPPHLDHDAGPLGRLFASAWEDGLVAIGLLAAAAPDDPEAAWEIARDWLDRVDDVATADALGWMVLGPAILAGGRPLSALLDLARHGHVMPRRAACAAGMAMTPALLEGPSAAALRERVGQRQIRFVEAPQDEALTALCHAFVKDPAPEIRKALRRLLRVWTKGSPAAVVAWADAVRGGLPRLLGDEVKRARRKADRG
jgi:hypothetical protein